MGRAGATDKPAKAKDSLSLADSTCGATPACIGGGPVWGKKAACPECSCTGAREVVSRRRGKEPVVGHGRPPAAPEAWSGGFARRDSPAAGGIGRVAPEGPDAACVWPASADTSGAFASRASPAATAPGRVTAAGDPATAGAWLALAGGSCDAVAARIAACPGGAEIGCPGRSGTGVFEAGSTPSGIRPAAASGASVDKNAGVAAAPIDLSGAVAATVANRAGGTATDAKASSATPARRAPAPRGALAATAKGGSSPGAGMMSGTWGVAALERPDAGIAGPASPALPCAWTVCNSAG